MLTPAITFQVLPRRNNRPPIGDLRDSIRGAAAPVLALRSVRKTLAEAGASSHAQRILGRRPT